MWSEPDFICEHAAVPPSLLCAGNLAPSLPKKRVVYLLLQCILLRSHPDQAAALRIVYEAVACGGPHNTHLRRDKTLPSSPARQTQTYTHTHARTTHRPHAHKHSTCSIQQKTTTMLFSRTTALDEPFRGGHGRRLRKGHRQPDAGQEGLIFQLLFPSSH